MKKISIVAIAVLTMVSCNKDKDAKTEKDTENKTETTATESAEQEREEAAPVKEILAIDIDSAGAYKQSFLLEKGHTYPFTTLQKDIMKITAPNGQSESITSESSDEVAFTVDDIKDNVYEITINFVSKRSSQSNKGKSVIVDTKASAPKEEGLKNKWTVDKALTGNQLKMKMETSGKILSISGFEPIYTKISTTIGTLTKDAEVKKQLLEQTKAGFNEKILKDQFSKNILVLPETGAKVGAKWTKSENISPDGKVKITTAYTLKSVENGVVTISISGGIPRQTDKQSQNGLTHSLSSELQQSGTISFDQKTGWIKNQTISVKSTQTESMTDGKQTESMSSVTNSTISVNP